MSRAEVSSRGEQGTKPAVSPRHSIALKTMTKRSAVRTSTRVDGVNNAFGATHAHRALRRGHVARNRRRIADDDRMGIVEVCIVFSRLTSRMVFLRARTEGRGRGG